jgi:2,5-diketo-D-gluconate reductase B
MKEPKLASGYTIPAIGLGTWMLTGQTCYDAVQMALEMGYTHIDTAAAYENEGVVGKAIEESGVDRAKLFITTKVWFKNLDYNSVLRACAESLEWLHMEYVDLLLIHWPSKDVPVGETLGAFSHLVKEGLVRSTGVSNFTIGRCTEALQAAQGKVPVTNNQVEFHPYFYQKDLLEFCTENNILLTAYSPLGRGKVLKDPVVTEIASRRGAGPSQVILAWLLQKGIVVIPKASSSEHLRANLEARDLELTAGEIAQIDALNRNDRLIRPGWADFDT